MREARQPALLLRLGPVQHYRLAPEPAVHADENADGRIHATDGLAHTRVGSRRQFQSAKALRNCHAEESMLAQRGNHILVLIAPELARSERAKALEGLQVLGKSAVDRL